MKRILILLAWMGAILFPITWIGRLAPGLRYRLGPAVRPLISPEWVHVVVHTALFAGLVLLVAYALRLPRNWISVLFLLLVVMGVGMSQEALQLISRHRTPGWAEAATVKRILISCRFAFLPSSLFSGWTISPVTPVPPTKTW